MKKKISAKRPTLVKPVPPLPNNFASVRQNIQDTVAREALEMVDATVDSAKNGQYMAMKCLFELVGLFPAALEPTSTNDGLAEILLRHLGIPENSATNSEI